MRPRELAWENLHDATLVRVEFVWASGAVTLHLKTGLPAAPIARIEATGARHVECARRQPWGPSVSILDVRGPHATADGAALRLEVELQSGDTLVVEASRIDLSA